MSDRERLLEALRTMPAEAFSWLLVALSSRNSITVGGWHVWPDGIGGFTRESQMAITETREAAGALIARQRDTP